MYLISAEGHKNADVHILIIKKTGEIWPSMKDVGRVMGVKNIFDLVLKEINGVCKTKNLIKDQINEYKMTEREIFEKFSNSSKDGKVIKIFTSEIISWQLLSNVVEVKRKEA